jgi:hypothetical protein
VAEAIGVSFLIAGHFGFAAAVKARERTIPLWALMLACQWLDVVFIPLFLSHIERIEPVPGTQGGYGEGIIYADYTHSLIGALLLSLAFGVAFLRRGKRDAVVLGAVVFSHWVLDLVVHRADMPILPGNAGNLPRLGFGLWQVPVASALVELALVSVGAYVYWKAAREVVVAAKQAPSKAHRAAAIVGIAGVITLALSWFGL